MLDQTLGSTTGITGCQIRTGIVLDRSQPYLFGGSTPLCPSPVQRQFTKAILKAGVKKIRIHDLRHSHATWLINSGVNVVAVSKRLGHTDINQTLETYTHLLASTDQGMQIELMIELRVEFLVMVMASLIMEF